MNLRSNLKHAVAGSLAAMFVAVGPAAAQDHPIATTIGPSELASRLDDGSAPFVLDVRTRAEYAEGHIAGAINIPHSELADRLDELGFETSAEVVVYCQAGPRAAHAAATLEEAGFSGVRDLEGHFRAWSAAERPFEVGTDEDAELSESERGDEASDSEGDDQ